MGLKWGSHGRYPTVVIREKREVIKASIAGYLGIDLKAAYEIERMYAVKIRASARRIYTELGKFGDPAGPTMKAVLFNTGQGCCLFPWISSWSGHFPVAPCYTSLGLSLPGRAG